MSLTMLPQLMELVVEIDHKKYDVLMDKVKNHVSDIETVVFTIQPKNARNNLKR